MTAEAPTAEATPAANGSAAGRGSASGGLSQLLSKILEQLNISAWLPAAMLVGNVALLVQLHSSKELNIANAVRALTEKPLGTLIVLGFSLLLATIVTQAFEFETIRLLEGYFNSTHRFIQAGLTFRIRRHAGKRSRLDDKRTKAIRAAFMQARDTMLELPKPFERAVLDFIEDDVRQQPHKKVPTAAVANVIKAIDWRDYVPADTLYRIDCIDARLDSYPDANRVLPTRLGNVLRASEDQLPLEDDEDLEGFVIRYYDQLPATLKDEHNDYRTRLEMYCCLVLVFVALAPLGLALLIGKTPAWGVVPFVAAYSIMAFVSYEAAIASARSYGEVLQEMGHQIRRPNEDE